MLLKKLLMENNDPYVALCSPVSVMTLSPLQALMSSQDQITSYGSSTPAWN